MVTLLFLLMLVQTAAPGTAGPASPCTAPEYRQFDFWIGDWEVRSAQGRVLGHNRITSILSGVPAAVLRVESVVGDAAKLRARTGPFLLQRAARPGWIRPHRGWISSVDWWMAG
jgi:hypothetical protein